jgi:NADH-quinone oxidoreductase subunit M
MQYTEIHWSLQSVFPLLGSLQFLPLAVMALVLSQQTDKAGRWIAITGAAIQLVLAGYLYSGFELQQTSMQFTEFTRMFGPLAYHAAVDGVSVLFILLSVVLTLMVLIYGLTLTDPLEKKELAAILVIQSTLMTQFTSLNMLWFLLASMVQLILIGYLLKNRSTATETDLALSRYFQFMGTGMLLLFMGILMLGWNYAHVHGNWQFDLFDLITTEIPADVRSVIFFLLFYGLAVRIPLFPMHGWFPLVAEHGTVAIAGVSLIGVKVGVFGLIRFVFPLLPEAVIQWQVYVVAFAATGIFYAALLALLQTNLRRLLAFAVVSHTSIMIIGLFSLEHAAFQGSLLLAINYGLASAGLLFMTGMVYRRTHTMLLNKLGGLFDSIPLIGISFLVAGLSIVGMPGTPGFDAAHLVLEASIVRFGALPSIAAALGNVIAAGFLLFAFQKAFLAPRDEQLPPFKIQKPLAAERILAGSMILILFISGFYSEPWMELIDASLQPLSALFAHH